MPTIGIKQILYGRKMISSFSCFMVFKEKLLFKIIPLYPAPKHSVHFYGPSPRAICILGENKPSTMYSNSLLFTMLVCLILVWVFLV